MVSGVGKMTRSLTRKEERIGVTTRSMARRKSALAVKADATKRPAWRSVERRWPTLLPELLEAISDRLPIRDLVSFRSVCRGWRWAPCGRSNIFKFSRAHPWFIIYDIGSQGPGCMLHDVSQSLTCTMRLDFLNGARCLESKYGWLLAHRSGRLFLANPFTLATIHLPPCPRLDPTRQVFTVASPPTSPDCTVFTIFRKSPKAVEVLSCRVGDGKWATRELLVDETQFGGARDLQCCSCYDGSSCDCTYERRRGIFCFDGNSKCLIYDPLEATTTVSSTGSSNSSSLYVDMIDRHRDEWLKKFGGEGVVVSACGISTRKLDGVPGFLSMELSTGGDGRRVSRVNGALVEPRF